MTKKIFSLETASGENVPRDAQDFEPRRRGFNMHNKALPLSPLSPSRDNYTLSGLLLTVYGMDDPSFERVCLPVYPRGRD